jgi:thiamine biosynthesis lipoprotein
MNIRYLYLFLILSEFLVSCGEKKPQLDSFSGYTQGTTYSIIYDNRKNLNNEKVKSKVEEVLAGFDMSLSLYKDSSIISRINRNEDVKPDLYFTEVFKKSVVISEMTSGTFDITVAPLVKAWGFGPDAHRNFSETRRDSLMQLVGMNKVSITDGRLLKSDPRITLDVNAIAQGYSVDVICHTFDDMGIKDYLIEIGGEVRARGTKAGAMWRIGIDKPEDNNMSPGQTLQAIIKISDKALATSGNYRKFYVLDGIKYSHTIDPRTGYPAKNRLLSATIIADECATADGIATACMVMGKDDAIEFINNHPEFSAYFVYSDDSGKYVTWMSESLKEYISEEN